MTHSDISKKIYWAHSPPENSDREPHYLNEHLVKVGILAAEFARGYGENWARLAGRWHDLGKYRSNFQCYIRQAGGFEAGAHIKGEGVGKVHSTAGALLAYQRFGPAGRILAYVIAGHHAGLSNWFGGLDCRLSLSTSHDELREALAENPPDDLLDHGDFEASLEDVPGGKNGFALWVRMLFSALVDADFLDTERYMDPEKFDRRNPWPKLLELTPLFDERMRVLARDAEPTPINCLRANILAQCRAKAQMAPGLFTLTVPTGGGKTLSGMAFALDHARAHDKRRVIHVIPYTSIIEQTANIFRGIFGDAVIEHHSNAETEPDKESSASRLACENWDAPIVVTTNVQFFESLFAARTSRCRKLHNLVDAVVILDEAQLLPPEFLQPILDVLNLLTAHYGVTVVLSTATQPALSTHEYFDAGYNMRGLNGAREIMDNPDSLHVALDRVNVCLPADWHTPSEWPDLAEMLCTQDSVLAIVNTRKDARALWEAVQRIDAGSLHLSALMCGAHRSDLITQIKARLKGKVPTRVISTQLIEAGVDLDFPVVYRALAGLDSIAQAAGRCNREGKLPGKGEVVVFVPPKPAPLGYLRKAEDACRSVLHGVGDQVLSPALFSRYFKMFYHACELDAHGICGDLFMAYDKLDAQALAVNFRTAADKFHLIQDEDSLPIVVRYKSLNSQDDSVEMWINTLRKEGPQRWLMRKLQRYTVNLHRVQALQLSQQGDIEELTPGLYVQMSSLLYDDKLGLLPDGKPLDLGSYVQ